MSSNIHSLNDFSGTAQRQDSANMYWSVSRNPNEPNAPPQHPSELRCIDLFLPGFTWKSSILVISGIQAIIYIISLFLGSSQLQPSGKSLDLLGSSYGPAIQNGEVYRLFTPIFLHASIWHILFNVYFQLRMGFSIEECYGTKNTLILYFVSGIAGNLFSVALAPCKFAVGASTAGFGLIGLQMGEMVLSWHSLQHKDQALFNIVVFVVVSLMLSLAPESTLDWRGHFGGFIAGFAICMLFNREQLRQQQQPKWFRSTAFYGSIAALVILYVGCTLVIFLMPMKGEHGRC